MKKRIIIVFLLSFLIGVACFSACTVESKSFVVSYQAEEGGRITGNTEQQISQGKDGNEVTAVADLGYEFVSWSDGKTDPTRKEENVNAAVTVTASFRFLFGAGKGTQAEPFLISEYPHFLKMAAWPSAHYKLTQDLDLQGIAHAPVFDENNGFGGHFDGNDRTIRNLTVCADESRASLFGHIGASGTVENLTLSGVSVTLAEADLSERVCRVGTLAETSFGKLNNISVDGSISANAVSCYYVRIGGLVGEARGTVTDCNSQMQINLINLSVAAASSYVGGLAGYATDLELDRCTAKGAIEITADSDYEISVGGAVGSLSVTPNAETRATDCLSSVSIVSTVSTYAGGFVGTTGARENAKIIISRCTANGNVAASYAGGFLCRYDSTGELELNGCVASNDVTCSLRAAGFAYKLFQAKVTDCHSGGSVTANGYAEGFCHEADDSSLIGCDATCRVAAINASGFIFYTSRDSIEKCFFRGEVLAGFRGAGFVFGVIRTTVSDCYCQCDFTVTNQDPNNTERTIVAGFTVGLDGSRLENCYYAGAVKGTVYTTGITSEGYMVAVFAGAVFTSTVKNCHCLHADKSYATEVITKTNDAIEEVELTVYETASDMFLLADLLNADSIDPVWINNADDFPSLNR